jgi:ABC-type branched-subunit amino acid transport system ATPase component/ABC-type branched-subunit amino acid transport system permease subunit
MSDTTPETPPTAPQEGPAIGSDEWVARSGENIERRGLRGLIARFEELPAVVRYGAFFVPFVAWPFLVGSDYLMQVGVDTLLYVLLALGLNVAVGWAGLLDLGYVAFYAFGAYGFALLASEQFDLHWEAQWAIPTIVLLTMLLGLLLGLPSWRLSGDYLAIVTLFFLQIFLVLLNNVDRPDFQFLENPPDWSITNGPNGISTVDPLTFFGRELTSLDAYYWVLVAAIGLVLTALYLANNSRTGRAWRALREDILAAELMSMPVRWLKLLAFVVGAGVAGLAGTIFAAQQGAVFPVNFDLTLLITLYAMVILGGAGSLAGVALGAIVINLSLELLRDPDDASLAFFGALVVVTLLTMRPFVRWAALAAGTIVFGLDAGRRLGRGLGHHPVGPADLEQGHVHRPDRGRAGAHRRARVVAARARGAGALPRDLDLGERDAAAAVRGAVPADRRDARGPDGGAAAGPARPAAGGDRLMADAPRLLELRNVSMAFGGLSVIDRLDLDVREHEIVSVIGPNGAGKTTLFNLITGVYTPVSGDILFEGESIVGLAPHKITRRGIARTFQTLRLFLNMTVRENVMAAAYGHTRAGIVRSMLRTPGMRREEREIRQLAEERLAFFGQRLMGYRWNQPAYSLSYANRRRLEIARATATKPRLLLLDEPAAGMNPRETHEITELIGQLRTDGGYTILVIEHDMHVVEGISDRVVALDHGVKIAEGSFEAVATDPRVVEAYLGTKAASTK